jgi:hypothetical protein
MRIDTIQTSFVSGELADDVSGRRDTPQLRNAARRMVNCWPRAAGGAVSRPGTWFLTTLHAGITAKARLYTFVGSNGLLYLAYFYQTSSDVLVKFYLWETVQLTSLLEPSVTACVPLGPIGTCDIERLRVASAFDTMFVVHPDLPPQVIRRTGLTNFSLSSYTIEAGSVAKWPFYRYAPQAVTITNTGSSGAGARPVTTSAAAFAAAQVGRAFRVFDTATGKWVYATMTAYSSPTSATFTFEAPGLTPSTAMPQWEEQAWSSGRGYPRSVCLFEQRLVIGGVRDAPDAVWLSRTGAYFNFDQGQGGDAEGIAVTLSNSGDGEIRHVYGGRYLIVLSANRARYFETASGKPLSPSNIVPRLIGDFGAHHSEPVALDDGVFYWQSDRVTLRRLSFDSAELERRVRTEVINIAAPDMEIGQDQFSMAAMPGSRYSPEELLVSPMKTDVDTTGEFYGLAPDVFDWQHMMVMRSGESGRVVQFARWIMGQAPEYRPTGKVYAVAEGDGFLFIVVCRILPEGSRVLSLEVMHPQMWEVPLDGARGTTGSGPFTMPVQHVNNNISSLTFYVVGSGGKDRLVGTVAAAWNVLNYTIPNTTQALPPFFCGVPYPWGVAAYPVKFDGQFGPGDDRRLRVVRASVLARPFDPVRIEGGSPFPVASLHIREQQGLEDQNGNLIMDENMLPVIGTVVLADPEEHVWRRARLMGWQQDGALRIVRDKGKPWAPVSVLSLAREVRM